MIEFTYPELGYFTERDMKNLKKKMDGRSYMHFEIAYSNSAGNCTLIIKTGYFDELHPEIAPFTKYEDAKAETLQLFMNMVISDYACLSK